MTQVGLKALIIPVTVALILLFATGIFEVKKSDFSCYNGKKIELRDKTPVVSFGSFRVNFYPIEHTCAEDERYDPAKVEKCGYQRFCPVETADES